MSIDMGRRIVHCFVLMMKKYDKKHDPEIICIRLWLDHLTSLCLETNVF